MPDEQTPATTPLSSVAVSTNSVIDLATAIAALIGVADPKRAGGAAAISAGLKVLDATLLPLLGELLAGGVITKAQQSALVAYSSALRAEAGAPQATIN